LVDGRPAAVKRVIGETETEEENAPVKKHPRKSKQPPVEAAPSQGKTQLVEKFQFVVFW